MKKGDKITILLHGHSEECQPDGCACGGVHRVPGVVTRVLQDGFVEAVIADLNHPFATITAPDPFEHDRQITKKRVLSCSPEMYEVTA